METKPYYLEDTHHRLHGPLNQLDQSRFLILFGQGVPDSYLDPQGEESTIEEALLAELKSMGFQRIAFYSTMKSLYYLDLESENVEREKVFPVKNPGPNSDTMQYLDNGPYGNRLLLIRPSAMNLDSSQPIQMGDVHAIRALDFMMRNSQPVSTALVFPNFENTINFFEDRRMLSGVLESWINLPENNSNRCVFLFSSSTSDMLADQIAASGIKSLENLVLEFTSNGNRSPSVCEIPGPGRDEIQRLLDREQQAKESVLSESDRNQLIRWMLGEKKTLKFWIGKTNALEKLDLDEVRREKWFAAVRNTHQSAMDELDQLIGLENIKNRIHELSAWMQLNLQKQRSENPDEFQPTLNFIFSGNPGTGKTTVARLMGEILHEIGYLKKGHLVEVSGLDLVADHLGGTAVKTNQIIDQALDGVLFIDEAYSLSHANNQDFGKEAIAALLTRMENDRHRLVVIAAGYPEPMVDFLKSNPGLSRRFPVDNFFNFSDFSPEELWEIFHQMSTKKSLNIAGEDQKTYLQTVQSIQHNARENFGNAGEIRNFVDAVDRKRAARVIQKGLNISEPLREADIPQHYLRQRPSTFESVEALLLELNQMVGLSEVKRHFTRLVRQIQLEGLIRQTDSKDHEIPIHHLIFSGNPGTGKTTVARLMGKLFKSLGLLKKGHCVEVSRADLVAGYVGQTALKTQKKLQEALEGVLFIDEAYALSRGSNDTFGLEAIDTLVKGMDTYQNRILIITAGYPGEMQNFIASNPGLKSRFEAPIHFQDFNLEELNDLFMHLAGEEGFFIPADIEEDLKNYFLTVKKLEEKNFGNARTIRQIFQTMKGNLAERIFSTMNPDRIQESIHMDHIKEFKLEDVPTPPLYTVSKPFSPKNHSKNYKFPQSKNKLRDSSLLM